MNARAMLFSIMALICLSVPSWMVLRYERALAQGEPVKFRCAPVDPYDPFRGRYVALGFGAAQNNIPVSDDDDEHPRHGQRVYALLEIQEDGFVRITSVQRKPPRKGLYFAAKVRNFEGRGKANLWLPFDRYYMKEQVAPEAERRYRESIRRVESGVPPDTYVLLRVHKGLAAIEGLYIEGESIEALLKQAIQQ